MYEQALRAEAARAQERHEKELEAKQQLDLQLQERIDLARVARVRLSSALGQESQAKRRRPETTI